MNDNYAVFAQSSTIDSLGDISPAVKRNIARAVNKTIARARTASARGIQEQVNLPSRYLSGASGRLTITKQASPDDLSAVITGRHRPTSLARFARAGARGKVGARVTVQPGLTRILPRAFFVRLRSGNTDTLNNLGLAIRVPDGKRPNRAYKPTPLGRGLWLLYGPSVDQVFDDVAEDIQPDTADFLETEFLRLMELDL